MGSYEKSLLQKESSTHNTIFQDADYPAKKSLIWSL